MGKKPIKKVLVGIIMGSDSDWPVMKAAAEVMEKFEIPYEAKVVSAHRTPVEMAAYAESAAARGVRVIIAGAGGAAHLPGMVAAHTHLPVVGVPVHMGVMNGQDALWSIVQMPKGVPVATMAIGGSYNAGLLAAQILAGSNPDLEHRLVAFKASLRNDVLKKKLEF